MMNRSMYIQNIVISKGLFAFVAFVLFFFILIPSAGAATAPTAVTASAGSINDNAADLKGTVFPHGQISTSAWFEWGETQSLGNTTGSQTFRNIATVTQHISGLQRNTSYYYRLVAQNSEGISRGSIFKFRTRSEHINTGNDDDNGDNGNGQNEFRRPTVRTRSADFVTETSAMLKGRTENYVDIIGNPRSEYHEPTTVWFQWGTAPGLGKVTPTQVFTSADFDFNFPLVGLQPNVQYYYRAVAENKYGISLGDMLTFYTTQTPTPPPPSHVLVVLTGNPTNISDTSVTLGGTAFLGEFPATTWFEWGSTLALGNTTARQSLSVNPRMQTISVALINLTPGATYYYRAVGEDSRGITRGGTFTFRTTGGVPSPVVPPTSSGLSGVTFTLEVHNATFPNGTPAVTAARAGNSVEYRYIVKNTNAHTVDTVTISDILPEEVDMVRVSDVGTYDATTREVRWTLSDIAGGATVVRTAQTLGKVYEENIVVENDAVITRGVSTKTSQKTLLLLNVAPILLSIEPNPSEISVGDAVNYIIRYDNQGDAAVTDVVLDVILPAGIRYETSDRSDAVVEGNAVTFHIGEVSAQGNGTIRIDAKVESLPTVEDDVTVIASLKYADTLLETQGEVSAYGTQKIFRGLGGVASVFGAGFLPGSLLGWILLILAVLATIYYAFRLYMIVFPADKKKEESQKKSSQEKPITLMPSAEAPKEVSKIKLFPFSMVKNGNGIPFIPITTKGQEKPATS